MEVKIKCTNYEITADWYEGSDNSRILIVLPGYGSSKARQKVHAEAMVRGTGTSAIAVDFSGHGNSPFDLRDTRPGQHLLELICVFDWLKQQYPNAVLSVSGSSYGGFLAVHLTKYRKFKNLVLRAPAIYRPSAFYDLWSKRIDSADQYDKDIAEYRSDKLALADHPLFENASSFTGEVLVVVHGKDEVVPRETTDAYIKFFHADSSIAEGFSHAIDREAFGRDRLASYQDVISHWLNS